MSSTSAQFEYADTTTPDIGEDVLFEILSNRRRRYTVHALARAELPMDLGTLAERVAAWEYEIDVDEVDYSQRKRVYTALQQLHLPKMDDAGMVDYDKRRGIVEPTEELADIEVHMEVVSGLDIPWSEYYIGLSAVSAALVVASALDVWPLSFLPDVAWSVFIVVAFAVSALFHRYDAQILGLGTTPPELRQS